MKKIFNISGRGFYAETEKQAEKMCRFLEPGGPMSVTKVSHDILDCWRTKNGRASVELLTNRCAIFVSDFRNHPATHFDGFVAICLDSATELSDRNGPLRNLSTSYEFPHVLELDRDVKVEAFDQITSPWGIVSSHEEENKSLWSVGFSTEVDLMTFSLSL